MRDFSKAKRVVIKIGTNTLTKEEAIEIDAKFIQNIAKQIVALRAKGIQIVIVTSGAIGMGAGQLKIKERVTEPRKRQACAAIGQPLLMDAYRNAFKRHNILTAQILLTSNVLDRRTTYVNLQNAISELLEMNVIPILNENDCVSTEEIGLAFGDNDKLSALVASKIDADVLVMLTDVDAFYDKNPEDPNAKQIRYVDTLTPEILAYAGSSGSAHATGGMKTKIRAVEIAFNAGCRIVLARGREKNVLDKIFRGEEIGTIFAAKDIQKRSNWERFILYNNPVGKITITGNSVHKIRRALNKGIKGQTPTGILPKEVEKVEGNFDRDAVILINGVFKAVTQLSSSDLRELKEKTQSEIKRKIGHGNVLVAKYSDIVEVKDQIDNFIEGKSDVKER
jgi:glutamate 5-kinase